MGNPLDFISQYYNQKILEFGATPRGVDWNGLESQLMRFEALSKVIDQQDFIINDLGCGYGAYFKYLCKTRGVNSKFKYHGSDIAKEMITSAKSSYPESKNCCWYSDSSLLPFANFSVASGIFNVPLDMMLIGLETVGIKQLNATRTAL